MNILFRCDANKEIGTGHAMRSLALAQKVQDRGHNCFLVYQDMPETLLEQWKEITNEVFSVNEDKNASEMITIIKNNQVDWVVLDGYHFDISYQEKIKEAGLNMLYIDDFKREDYVADIVLKQGLMEREAQKNVKVLSGPLYVLLRDEFLQARVNTTPVSHVSKVLLTMGGSDPNNFTSLVLRALEDMGLDVIVLIGAANPKANDFLKVYKDNKNISVYVNPENVSELMKQTQLAVHAAGSTSWELAHLGVPGLCYVLADNQQPVAETVAYQGCGLNMGRAEEYDEDALKNNLDELIKDLDRLNSMRNAGLAFIDGQGANRVIEELENAAIYN